MTIETYDAIFEQGIFRVVSPRHLPLRDGQRVRLVVEVEDIPDSILDLATAVYTGLSIQDISDIEQMAMQRSDMFGPAL